MANPRRRGRGRVPSKKAFTAGTLEGFAAAGQPRSAARAADNQPICIRPRIDFPRGFPHRQCMPASDTLLAALSGISGTGDFHSTGATPFFLPGLVVDGVGEIAFPLPAAQAKELIAVAGAAPYGKGAKTVHDESVRKCWQIDASGFSIKSPAWTKFLKKTIYQVRSDLGIVGKVSAKPYKLLIYGKGGHFKAHRDSEKLDAMFGTLIVALPSAHEGGRLFIIPKRISRCAI